MEEIATRYAQVKQAMSKMDGATLFSNAGKDFCEWDTLGTIQQLLLSAGRVAPTFACKGEAPDFRTYLANREPWDPFEITDVLRPGYKMHEFHKLASRPNAPMFDSHEGRDVLEHPWEPLRERITAKSHKTYPAGTCLAVYYNIMLMRFPDMDTPFHHQLLAEHTRVSFADLARFGRVLILDSAMQCLVQLHPSPSMIVPDR